MGNAPGSTPLVGREVELATLAQLAGVGTVPASGLVLLSGDAGIGKSRLLAALRARAADAGWRVAVGHCLDLGGSPLPYLPFTELATRLQAMRPERMAQLAERWPEVRRLLGAAAGPSAGPEPADRAALFTTVHAVLTDLAQEAPLLVVLEDLHWADQSTCALLSFLFTRQFAAPVSVVASYRSDDLHRGHPLRGVVAAWSRLPDLRRMALEPLPDDQVRRLVEVLRPGGLSGPQVQGIVDRAEGNAFFTEELVAAARTPGGSRDLADLMLLRLDRLGPDARAVARAAAVGGRLVPDSLLAEVAGLPPDRFDGGVREAVEFQVLVPEDSGYRFRHSLLGEAVYGDLLPGERRRTHAAYVAALAGSPPCGTPADLARHAVGAGDVATAYRASVQAGDDAAAVGGPDEAAQHYRRALDLLTSGDRDGDVELETVVALTEKAASAALAAGHVRRAESTVAGQLERLPEDAAAGARARLLVALAEAAAMSDSPHDELALSGQALELVPAEPPTVLRARAVAVHALALAADFHDEEAARWAEEGLAMPPEVRTAEATLQLQTVLARLAERGGNPQESQRLLRESAETARAAGDPAEIRALHQLGSLHFEQGELQPALAAYRRSADRSVELGRPFAPYGVAARTSAAVVAFQLGQWDLALELTAVDADTPALAAAGLLAARLSVSAGLGAGLVPDRGGQVSWTDQMAVIRPQWATEGMIAVQSGTAAVELHGQAGDLDAAVAVHDDVVATLRQVWGRDDAQARIRLGAVLVGQVADHVVASPGASLSAHTAHAAHALEVVDQARRAEGMGRQARPGPESRAWLLRLEAEVLRLRRSLGEPVLGPDLVGAWRASVEAFEGYGHVFEHARSEARLAAALRSTGATGAAAESSRTATAALEVARRLGAQPLVAELRPLVPGQTGGPDDVLTPREREVLALVAEGSSNREVGLRLFVSAKTASVHVSNILGKLGAHSRTEAVAIARRRGLLVEAPPVRPPGHPNGRARR